MPGNLTNPDLCYISIFIVIIQAENEKTKAGQTNMIRLEGTSGDTLKSSIIEFNAAFVIELQH